MKELHQQIYRFAEVEIDPSQNCLRINGQELYLRHKLMQLLVYLLEQRHHVVSKRDLIEEVWEGAAITHDALVQAIKELRRILDDDPRQPRFIKTVPKVGYRFIAPVEEDCLNEFTTQRLEQTTSVEMGLEKSADRGSRSVPSEARLPAKTRLTQRLRSGYLFSVLAVLLLAGIVAFLVLPTPWSRDQQLADVTLPQLPGKKNVAVMYFDNQSGNPRLDWLREGLADMLITDLSRSGNLTLLNRWQLHLLLERIGYSRGNQIRLDEALRLANMSGAEIVAMGSFTSVDDSVRIDVQCYETQSKQLLAAESMVLDKPKDILTGIDLLSLKLAAHLETGSVEELPKRGLAEVMTNNLEAYRCYSLALEKAQSLHNTEAIALLQKAVGLDPQFAMAHARIGYAYGVTWNLPEKARPYLRKAFQLSERLTEKDRLLITAWYEIASQNYPGAIAAFRNIIAQYPLEVEAYGRLALLLQGEDRLEEAVEVTSQGLIIDPESMDLYNLMGGLYALLGKHQESIGMRQRYVELAQGEPNSHDSLGMSYQWAGRYEEAIQEYRRALELKPDFEIALVHLANVHFQLGRYQEAISLYRKYIDISPSERERARGYASIIYAYWKKGDLYHARQTAKLSEQAHVRLWAETLFAMERGELDRAARLQEQYLAKVKSYTDRGSRANLRTQYQLRGAIALKSGRAAEAIELFKEALSHRAPIWNIDVFEDCLANAYLELGQLDEAIDEFKRILVLYPNYPLAHYHLAQAFERKGEADNARAAYQQFLHIWKAADPDLHEVMISWSRLK
jgi:tetratricopeptide (TPR) repeat protein